MKSFLAKLGCFRSESLPYVSREIHGSCLELDKWTISRFIIDRLVPVVGIHPFPLDELQLMAGAVITFRPKHIFEWGTNIGKSARIFHETSKWFSLDVKIHSIDLKDDETHPEHPGEQRGIMVRGVEDVKLYQGDGLDTSLQICGSLGESLGCPLFFVDGDHRLSSVRRDLEGILSHLPDAVVLVHDTFFQTMESRYNIGPHLAIEEVMNRYPFQELYERIDAGPGLPGMSLIHRKDSRNLFAAKGFSP